MSENYFLIRLKMTTFVFQKNNTMTPEITNYFGYAASFFVVLSFMLKDITRIRIVNLVGCILFVLYGIYSNYLWPIIIPNAVLCFIQGYHLIKKKS